MIQLISFLTAQLIFVPVYLQTTQICITRKLKLHQKLLYILISPFSAYMFVNVLFGLLSSLLPNHIFNSIISFSDIMIILLSFMFVLIYNYYSMKLDKWNATYYSSIYLTFFLLEMAFNCVYVTVSGSIIGNICIPLIVITYYRKRIIPMYCGIKGKPPVHASRSLFLLPAVAELFFIYRSLVVWYLSSTYPIVSVNNIPANIILTFFSYILICFIFLSTAAILRNILTTQDIKIQSDKNAVLTTDMIKALVKTIDAKDPYTNGHSIRVAEYSRMIAKQEFTDKRKIQNIYNIALLHDIGKIGVADTIINKTGKLTDEEYGQIKDHTLTGAEILSEITSFPDLIYGAKYHHERYDGKGYPCGLKGEQIPEIAAIISVADAYDAMTSNRSYRKLLPQEVVRKEIENGLGKQFHPKWGSIMLKLIDQDPDYQMHQ